MKNNLKLNFFVLFMTCAIMLTFSTNLRANEIDLSKPISIEPGKGVVIFSFTTWGVVQDGSNVRWRSLDKNGWTGQISINLGAVFGNEEFSKTSRHALGRFVGFNLPAGNYEFYSFNSASYQKIISTKRDFSRRFVVEAGKIQYIGNLDILATQPVFSGGSILAAAFIGTWFGFVDVYPSLMDTGDIDLPLLAAKGVAIDNISRNVISNEEDNHMLDVIGTLKINADKGDLIAKSRLMTGLTDGWFMTETGEEIKLKPDSELQKQLAEQLAIEGVHGGAFFLGEMQNPIKNKKPASDPVDGTQILNYYLSDAEKYYWPAVARIVDLYDKGILGVAKDSSLSRFWEERLGTLKMPSTRNIPYLDKTGKGEFQSFLDASLPRYFAVSTTGAFGLSKGDVASAKEAVTACEERNQGSTDHCRLFAKNRWIVWDACPPEYAGHKAMAFPPITNLGKVADTTRLPNNLSDTGKAAYRDFLAAPLPRAFAISDTGEAVMASGDCHAAYKALKECAKGAKKCELYAIDDQIVLGATDPKLVEMQQRLFGIVEKEKQSAAAADIQLPPADTALASLKSQE